MKKINEMFKAKSELKNQMKLLIEMSEKHIKEALKTEHLELIKSLEGTGYMVCFYYHYDFPKMSVFTQSDDGISGNYKHIDIENDVIVKIDENIDESVLEIVKSYLKKRGEKDAE